ncbi:MAG: 50S ribosomal protein L11 methyltransferase [Spirulina sp. SIO3F2]|nr:50S ribosomal protein L11 methyltransferase [Spirulina sp. SIO3F2]
MSSQWWEIKIQGDAALEELVYWRLDDFGCHGMATEPQDDGVVIRAYAFQESVQELDLAALTTWIRQDVIAAGLAPPQITWTVIDEEDWASNWKANWEPQEIGDRFLINPAWLEIPDTERLVLRLDPGAAFGTGVHPTTQLCLESLEMRGGQSNGETVIGDIGCGSGILAIGAIRLGMGKVYAVDTDPLAVKVAKENIELNQISGEQIIVTQGSLDQILPLAGKPVDGLVCNILAETITEMIPDMTDIVKSKGWAILSGILLDQAKDVADVLESNGWIVATLWKRGEWCCFNTRKAE